MIAEPQLLNAQRGNQSDIFYLHLATTGVLTRLVFAASTAQIATKIDQIMLSSQEVAATARFAPISITGGVLADEAIALFPK